MLLEKSHVPKTLLAVDDSATMRKVLEITFGGEDFRVLSADGAAGALAKMGEEPVAVVIDTSLGGDDAYALAKDVRARSARTAIVIMSSRYNPYDANRGREAGVDDSVDKPFDTQSLIDKVKKAVLARETARAAAPPPQPAMNVTAAFGGAPRPPAAPPAPVSTPQSAPSTVTGPKGWPTQRTHTLSFEGMPQQQGAPPPAVTMPAPLSRTAQSGPGAPQPPPAIVVSPPPAPAPAPAPPPPPPAPAPVAVAQASVPTAVPAAPAPTAAPPRAEAPAASSIQATTNGHLAGKLDELGLTPQQVDAVLSLSRELVERVVWEVVPALAEALIKEEILRLTKET
jgi:DNA-binding response OmpR family regulator